MAQVIEIDRECRRCPLGHGRAVAGAGPSNLLNVKLILISDNVGHYDEEEGVPFVSNDSKRMPRKLKKGGVSLEKPRNSGSMIRKLLVEELGMYPDQEVWLTNVMKCSPGKNKPKEADAKKCCLNWLVPELNYLDQYVPRVPILIAGNLAFKTIINVYKDCSFAKEKLRDCRRTSHHKLLDHPVFFTYNPGAVSKSEWAAESGITKLQNGRVKPNGKLVLENLILSPLWIYKKDLEEVDRYLRPGLYEEENLEF